MHASTPRVVSAQPADIPAAVDCVVAAFADDPLMAFFFPGTVDERSSRCCQFMSLLLRVRLALQMPAMALKNEVQTLGLAMGYSTVRHDWPSSLQQEWDMFVAACPGLLGRFDSYDNISSTGTPTVPHYYLGVLAIHPNRHGTGLGGQLLEAFCSASESDPESRGVYLETAKPENVLFYERRGFKVQAEGLLDEARLWCMYRPSTQSAFGDA